MNDAKKIKDQLIDELKEQELAEQFQFERLIADIASQLAQTKPDQWRLRDNVEVD